MKTAAAVESGRGGDVGQIGIVEAPLGFITCGAETREDLEQVVGSVTETLPDHCSDPALFPVERFPYEFFGIPPSYLQAARNPFRSTNWHLQRGGSRLGGVSFIDWWTFLDGSVREKISGVLFERFVKSEACGGVAERSDIPMALESRFPGMGQHGLEHLLGERVWEFLKRERREQLSSYSRRAVENGKKGKGLEERFEGICERNGLRCYRGASGAFRRHLPQEHEQVRRKTGNLKGVPDYLVDKGNPDSLERWLPVKRREWEPEGRYAFVECKYDTSNLSGAQRRMVKVLESLDLEVYVFRGDDSSYEFRML